MSVVRPKRTVSALPSAVSARFSKVPPAPVSVGRAHALDVPFEYRAVASAAGARWDEAHKVFVYRGAELPAELAPFRSQPYSHERRVEARINDPQGTGKRAASQPAGNIVPRAHQLDAMRAVALAHGSDHPGFLLADDVGLGKTISAWGAVLRMAHAETVLVVCPLAVVAHWRRTIEAMGDGGKDVVVMNYERVGKLFEVAPAARAKVKSKKGLAKVGTAEGFDVVVWDESHRLKNPTAARSKLAAKINGQAGFVLWLSATAGQNPLELSYLAALLASVSGDKASDLKAFELWCMKQGLGVTRGAFGKWDWRGDPKDCELVRALLFDGRVPAGIRRRPEDIVGWPELNRMLVPIGLEGEARALYAQAWTEFRKALELDPQGKNPKGALAATLRLRQKGSLLRVPGTVELAQELLDNGHQVAISVAFMETLTTLQAALAAAGCAVIHGQLAAADKERERLRFQRGEARVVLFTVEEGISLHQGEHNDVVRSEVIHDLRWSAIQMAQIEGRCHRDGKFAQVYWTYADDTIEARIAQIVCGRITSMKGMIGDDTATLKEIDAALRAG